MSDSLQPHGLLHARLPCPSPFPRVCSNSMSIELVMPSNHFILCLPLLLLPSIFPSIRVFSNESALPIRWLKYWSFSFSLSPSNEYSGLIFFRIDWFDLLAVQGTLKSLLQHRNLKASILRCSAFFMVHLSHPYMTIEKAIALTIQVFVSKVMSVLSALQSCWVWLNRALNFELRCDALHTWYYLLWLIYSKCQSAFCLAYFLFPSCKDCSRKTGRRASGSQSELSGFEEKLPRTDGIQTSPEENPGLLWGCNLGTVYSRALFSRTSNFYFDNWLVWNMSKLWCFCCLAGCGWRG